MYNVSVAGLSTMLVVIVISALSIFVPIKVENSKEIKITKKNTTEV